MKTTLRLMLTVALTGLAALPSLATPVPGSSCSPTALDPALAPAVAPVWLVEAQPAAGGGSFELQCAQFCAIALCAYPQVCGVFFDSTGQKRCGCHDRGVREVSAPSVTR